MHIVEDGLDREEKDMEPITSLKSFGKLSTVPYFFVRPSSSSAYRFGWPSLFHMYRGGGLWSLLQSGEGGETVP